jgi:cellulose synthase/poly-beta-1,6-N-acetylglucosamine synthase-like glycosyltransferase
VTRQSLRSNWTLFAPAAACALLGGWIALSTANVRATGFSVLMLLLGGFIVYTDGFDFMLRRYAHRRHTASGGGTSAGRHLSVDLTALLPAVPRRLDAVRPYAIIASVFNFEDKLDDFIEAFAPYRERVWLISDGSTDNTVTRFHQAGWRCLNDRVNRRKPGALRALLARLPVHIETVMVIDPDIWIRGRNEGSEVDLERFIGDFQQTGAAAVCPRIMIEPDGFLCRFQAFEYALACRIGRESLADYNVTSGVAFYRRDALARALDEHSLSVYAEDLENTLILLSHSERIYYDGRLVISTEGAGTWRRWFSQRVGWYYGLIKVYTERFGQIRRISRRAPFAAYQYVIYLGVMSLMLHVFKIASVVLLLISLTATLDNIFDIGWMPHVASTEPVYFVMAAGSYLLIAIIVQFTLVPEAERAYTAPIVPLYLLYSMLHVVPMSVGYGNWIAVKLWGRRLFQDHFEPGGSVKKAPRSHPTRKVSDVP